MAFYHAQQCDAQGDNEWVGFYYWHSWDRYLILDISAASTAAYKLLVSHTQAATLTSFCHSLTATGILWQKITKLCRYFWFTCKKECRVISVLNVCVCVCVNDLCMSMFWCATLSPSRSEAARAERREDNDPADNGGVESGKWGWICTVLQAVPLHPVSHTHMHTHTPTQLTAREVYGVCKTLSHTNQWQCSFPELLTSHEPVWICVTLALVSRRQRWFHRHKKHFYICLYPCEIFKYYFNGNTNVPAESMSYSHVFVVIVEPARARHDEYVVLVQNITDSFWIKMANDKSKQCIWCRLHTNNSIVAVVEVCLCYHAFKKHPVCKFSFKIQS